MKTRLYLRTLLMMFIFLCRPVAGDVTSCEVSKEELPNIPEDIGSRVRGDVVQKMAAPDLYNTIMIEPLCDRVGSILLAITIRPDGTVINVKKLGSTLPNDVIEQHLVTMIPAINFGKVDATENSTVYVPLTFKGTP